MKYMYWFVALIVATLGIGFSVYMSSETEVISKMQYEQFSTVEKVSDTVLHQLNAELKTHALVFLGVMPGRQSDLEVWKAFVNQAQYPDLQFQVVVINPDLPHIKKHFPNALEIDLKSDMTRFIEGAKNARAQGVRMVVVAPSMYVSQILSENPTDLLLKNSDLKPLSISLIPFPMAAEEEAQMQMPCVMGANDREGTGALGCLAVKKGRALYPSKKKAEFFEGLIEQTQEHDYVFLLNDRSKDN